jgi:hypothetical protein
MAIVNGYCTLAELKSASTGLPTAPMTHFLKVLLSLLLGALTATQAGSFTRLHRLLCRCTRTTNILWTSAEM